MPNWVRNRVTITGSKSSLDKLHSRLEDGLKNTDNRLLAVFKPMPEILSSLSTGYTNDSDTGESLTVWRVFHHGNETKNVKIPDDEMKELIAKHGTASWYDWACKNWGIKWDRDICSITRTKSSIQIDVDYPWSYPEPIYQMIADEYNVSVSVRLVS